MRPRPRDAAARRGARECPHILPAETYPAPRAAASPGLAADRALRDTQRMSLYDLQTPLLDGTPADLGDFRGKVTLVVNVASECGFTPQYTGLQKLHAELSEKGFSVLGFPSNEFGGQEPGD